MAADESVRLAIVQPSARRREWNLERNGQALARLRIPALRSGARVDVGGEQLRIVRLGRVRAEYLVRAEQTREEIARLRREGRRLLLDQNGEVREWKRIGRKEGFAFVGTDGTPFVRATLRSGLLRSSGDVAIAGIVDRDALVAAILASYLLIRKSDETAASVAATTTVVAS